MVKPDAQKDEGTEQRILDAADAVFVRRGTDGARMQEIAEEAGVNKALLHYYYRTKDRLAEAVFRRAAGTLFPAVVEIMSSDLGLEEKVERVIPHYLDALGRRPYLPGYLISEITHHPDRLPPLFASIAGDQIKKRVLTTLARQIDERVRAGTMAPIAPEQFLVNIIALCVFPFAARPLICTALGLDTKGFERFMEARRKTLPAFVARGLRP
ncbi:MAG TPA: TetR/AcrR family transcriptional regulator [Vicinamibacteria bacterium]|nr:TetR/AcrR family transcriptional regulator [Vicinamibacteria bacterium]